MRNLIIGAALAFALLACGAAAAHQWDEERIADLEWQVSAQADRIADLEAAVWPLDDWGGPLDPTWPGDDGGR